ncbi:Uncharacterized protein EJ110_NYTH59246 [Nymphaea thermarum]|nr:Uncharacterized protein EJ110_NYTH59246 [Nymphaea thermarum]
MSVVAFPAARVAYPPPPSSSTSLAAFRRPLRLYVGPLTPSRAAGRRGGVSGHVQAVVKRSPKRLKYSAPRLNKPLSILCHTLHDIDTYTLGFPRGNNHGQTSIFRAVKHCLPGPYTFILPASKELPKQCTFHGTVAKCVLRKTVGVRMPDDPICQAILEKLDQPLICTSVKSPTEDGWMVDPAVMADMYGEKGLDFIVDGGIRVADPSTIVDMTGSLPTVIRQGKGPTLDWMVSPSDEE